MWTFILIVICLIIIIPILNNDDGFKNQEIEKRKAMLKDDYDKYIIKYKELLKKYKDNDYYYEEDGESNWDEEPAHYAIFNNSIHILEDLDEEYELKYIASNPNGVVPDKVEETVYDIEKIRYYKLEGSIYQKQQISGGGGGGSSIKGAVVGGLIAGGPGAIIGSRKKNNNIETTYVEEDDRRLVITFKNDKELKLPYKFYDRLLDYIPEKDYDNYITNKKQGGKKWKIIFLTI